MDKLLVLSDVHYPLTSIAEVAAIIRKVRPDNVALLGDNIEPSASALPATQLYRRFVGLMSKAFPMRRTILMLGDNDYLLHGDSDRIFRYVDSLGTMNDDHVLYRCGNMVFSHGNIERSRHLEAAGKAAVGVFRGIGAQGAVPAIVCALARLLLRVGPLDYLFLGHIHLLRKMAAERTVFCGTLNRHAAYFGRDSLGYVVVRHDGFRIRSADDISTVSIARIEPGS